MTAARRAAAGTTARRTAGSRPAAAASRAPAAGGPGSESGGARCGIALLIAAAGLVVLHPPADPPAGAGAGAAAGAGEGSTGMPVVTIAGGDTLWEIARSVRPRRDPRVEVAQIIRVNGLPGPVVHVGQRLRVP